MKLCIKAGWGTYSLSRAA